MKSSTAGEDTDVLAFSVPVTFPGYYHGFSRDCVADKRSISWLLLRGHSRNHAGTVELKSADPIDAPNIHFRYFHEGTTVGSAHKADLNAVVEGIKFVRSIIAETTELMQGQFEEVSPGPSVDTDAELAQWVMDNCWGHHASCTCKIGAENDPMDVLNSKFEVRGTAGLRVVDASVFPKIPGFFVMVPIYMIAEKAAEEILSIAPQN
jgi:choline dehydrogenase